MAQEEERRERLAHVVVRRLSSSEYSAEVEGKDDIRVRAPGPVEALDGVRKMLGAAEDGGGDGRDQVRNRGPGRANNKKNKYKK